MPACAKDLVIPYGEASIPVDAFSNEAGCTCPILETVEIAMSVTKIGERAFRGCANLVNVTFPKPATWQCDEDALFTKTDEGKTVEIARNTSTKKQCKRHGEKFECATIKLDGLDYPVSAAWPFSSLASRSPTSAPTGRSRSFSKIRDGDEREMDAMPKLRACFVNGCKGTVASVNPRLYGIISLTTGEGTPLLYPYAL